MLKNTEHRYGLVAILLHWGMALAVIGLFALGLYMRSLSYYDPWYRTGPELHKGIGILLFIALLVRLLWRRLNPVPQPEATSPAWERTSAALVHGLLYLLLAAVMLSGYLISTADGRAIEVFGWFEVPATLTAIDNQEDLAGAVHNALAWSLIAVSGLHALAALKHHLIDKDNTLRRMLGRS